MKNQGYLHWLSLILCVGLFSLFWACAGTRDSSAKLDEEAFPSDSSENAGADTSSQAEEAEVLRLLGITKESEKTQPAAEKAEPTATGNMQDLEVKLDELEKEAKKKNVELDNLKSELAERDRRLTDLQSELTKPQKSTKALAPITGGTFKARYDQALSMYYDRKYKHAISMFDELLAENENNSLVDNCQYWKGEAYYALDDFNQAIIEFEKVFVFNNSNKSDAAQLKIGLCYLKVGNKEKARNELQRLLTTYPTSEYVAKAQSYLANL
jgi:TolA-binding protein